MPAAPALDRLLPLLRCPVCAGPLHRTGSQLRCGQGHSFDVARQGYVSLFAGRRALGDRPAMVAARERVQAAGYLTAVREACARAVRAAAEAADRSGVVVDLAGGTGYYLARVLEVLPQAQGVVLDAATPALRRAAAAHPRAAAVGCDVRGRLPLATGVSDVVLSVFGPRHPAEIGRVLRPGGALVVVTPRPAHLAELTGPMGLLQVDPAKEERLAAQLAAFERIGVAEVTTTVPVPPGGAADLAAMGPAAFHHSAEEIAARAARLPADLMVTVSVEVATYRR